MMLNHHMAPSMKKRAYSVQVAFTKKELLCCSCNCQAGSKGLDRGVCVHVLPVILLLSILLMEGLAQNLLVELSNRWTDSLDSAYDSESKNKIYEAVTCLMNASNSKTRHDCNRLMKISEVLGTFSVGTEKIKLFHVTPHKDELIPIRKMQMQSTNNLVKNRLSSVPDKNRTTNDSSSQTHPNNDNSIISLKTGVGGAMAPVLCDFCTIRDEKSERMLTTHICRLQHPGAKRKIVGTEDLICGLAFCLNCRIHYGTLEGELCDRRCFHHNDLCNENFVKDGNSLQNESECNVSEDTTEGFEIDEPFHSSTNSNENVKFIPNYT